MDYSNRLCSGSVARRRATDRDAIDMIKALERGLDLKEADMADDDSAASVEIGQFEQADAFTRSTGGGRRGGESSLPSFAVRQAGARVLQGRGGDHESDQGSSRGSTASQNLGGGGAKPQQLGIEQKIKSRRPHWKGKSERPHGKDDSDRPQWKNQHRKERERPKTKQVAAKRKKRQPLFPKVKRISSCPSRAQQSSQKSLIVA